MVPRTLASIPRRRGPRDAEPFRDNRYHAAGNPFPVRPPGVTAAMASGVPRIPLTWTVREAAEALLREGWPTGIVLTPEGGPAGLIGPREILGALSKRTGGFFTELEFALGMVPPEAFDSGALRDIWRRFWETPVATLMRGDVPAVSETESVSVAAGRMLRACSDLVVVTRGGQVVGALRPSDILESLQKTPEQVRRKPHPHRARPHR